MVKTLIIYKRGVLTFGIVLFTLILGSLIGYSTSEINNDYQKEDFKNNYRIYSLTLPSKLSFASENAPLNKFDTRESLDRELLLNTYWQSQSILMHKRAYRWFAVISPILKQNNIPDDFKYLALIESGFTLAVSPSGATGFWQFLDKTATNYGLTVNENVDERYNVEKSTKAACKYFKEAYAKFNNWTLVAASYNMGITGLSKQLQSQEVDNYYDLLLNQETSRYIFRILALKEILEHPQKYGFNIRKKDLYPQIPTHKVVVDSTVTNLTAFSQRNKINYKLLKILNPWLRQNTLENKDHIAYTIELPNDNYDEVMLAEIYEGNPSYTQLSDTLGYIGN